MSHLWFLNGASSGIGGHRPACPSFALLRFRGGEGPHCLRAKFPTSSFPTKALKTKNAPVGLEKSV